MNNKDYSCTRDCRFYRQGCAYLSFNSPENIRPGEQCIHPEIIERPILPVKRSSRVFFDNPPNPSRRKPRN
jgi:hypothetical protein